MVKKTKDELWSEYHSKIERAIEARDWYDLADIYYSMAKFVKNEGRNPEYIRTRAYEAKRKAVKENTGDAVNQPFYSAVELSANPGACDNCRRASGKYVPSRDLFSEEPVPNCLADYGCRCTYLPVIKESHNGKD